MPPASIHLALCTDQVVQSACSSDDSPFTIQIATGKGALGQLQLELGLPSYGVDLLVLGILGYSLAGAFNPATYSESNQRDVKKRNPGQARAFKSSSYLHLDDVLEPLHNCFQFIPAPQPCS